MLDRRKIFLYSFCFLLVGPGLCWGASPRIVAVGDVHGAYRRFVTILQKTGLIDGNHRWTGSNSILVQVGDLMDRGPQSREALDLVMSLEEQAKKQNGRVIVVLGNHEALNIVGSWRPTAAAEYKPFADAQSEKVREKAFQDYLAFLAARAERRGLPPPDEKAERPRWIEAHPLGFIEHAQALGPQGRYGRWIRERDAVALVQDVLFAHAGLDPELPFASIEDLNHRLKGEIAEFDSLWQFLSQRRIIWEYMNWKEAYHEVKSDLGSVRKGKQRDDPEVSKAMKKFVKLHESLLISRNSPMWYRGVVHRPTESLNTELVALLARWKARYLVVGHSPIKAHRIKGTLDNLVFRIDTGMTDADGQASALEIRDGRFTAYYASGKPELLYPTANNRPKLAAATKGAGQR